MNMDGVKILSSTGCARKKNLKQQLVHKENEKKTLNGLSVFIETSSTYSSTRLPHKYDRLPLSKLVEEDETDGFLEKKNLCWCPMAHPRRLGTLHALLTPKRRRFPHSSPPHPPSAFFWHRGIQDFWHFIYLYISTNKVDPKRCGKRREDQAGIIASVSFAYIIIYVELIPQRNLFFFFCLVPADLAQAWKI